MDERLSRYDSQLRTPYNLFPLDPPVLVEQYNLLASAARSTVLIPTSILLFTYIFLHLIANRH